MKLVAYESCYTTDFLLLQTQHLDSSNSILVGSLSQFLY